MTINGSDYQNRPYLYGELNKKVEIKKYSFIPSQTAVFETQANNVQVNVNTQSIVLLRTVNDAITNKADKIQLFGYNKSTDQFDLQIGEPISLDINSNIENGTGDYSLVQKEVNGKQGEAIGRGSAIFGGFRGDKPNDTPNSIPTNDAAVNNLDQDDYNDTISKVTGVQSYVFGAGNRAYGNWNFIAGKDSKTTSRGSFAFGGKNYVGDPSNVNKYLWSIAIGSLNTVGSPNTFAAGTENTVNGDSAVVLGRGNNVSTTGYVMGISNTVSGDYSVALGNMNNLTASWSSVLGSANTVSGRSGKAVGESNSVQGGYAIAIGNGLNVPYNFQIALGKYNAPMSSDILLAVGNGSGTSGAADEKSTAFEITNTGIAKVYGAPVGNNDVVRKLELDTAFANLNIENGDASGSLNQKGATQASLVNDYKTYGAAYAYLSATGVFVAGDGPEQIEFALNDFSNNYDNLVKYTAAAFVYIGAGQSFPNTGVFETDYATNRAILFQMITSGEYDDYINAAIPQVEQGIATQIATDLQNLGLTLSDNKIADTGTLSLAIGSGNKIYSPTSLAVGYGNTIGRKGYPQNSLGSAAIGKGVSATGKCSFAVGSEQSFTSSSYSGGDAVNARIFIKGLQMWYNDPQNTDDYAKSKLPSAIATASSNTDYDAIVVKMGEAHGDNSISLGGSTFSANSITAGYALWNSGLNASVFGNQNVNAGFNSIISGSHNYNSYWGTNSAIFGIRHKNGGSQLLISGTQNEADAYSKSVLGWGLKSLLECPGQLVTGRWNVDNNTSLFIVGNGEDGSPSNAFEVTADGVAKAYGTPSGDDDLITKGYADSNYSSKTIYETKYIQTTDWIALSNNAPYTYFTTTTATTTISENAIVELINDNPVLFATYGFAIDSVNNQNIIIYSINQPDSVVSLTIGIGG